jgi:energy-coupling factor transporter ATP-binding protein EcfA2
VQSTSKTQERQQQQQFDSVDLSFQGLQLILDTKKGGTKLILDGSIKGMARAGRMLAIMGPSGAGKSTVLHALAGRIKEEGNNHLILWGRRYVNGRELAGDSMLPATAFIEQDVQFFPHMTVRFVCGESGCMCVCVVCGCASSFPPLSDTHPVPNDYLHFHTAGPGNIGIPSATQTSRSFVQDGTRRHGTTLDGAIGLDQCRRIDRGECQGSRHFRGRAQAIVHCRRNDFIAGYFIPG